MHPKEWRKSEKLSQAEVAAKLTEKTGREYRQSHISAWEKGAMADAFVGDAYREISRGKVRGVDFGKPLESKEEPHG